MKRIDAFVSKLRRCHDGGETDIVRGIAEEMRVSFETAIEADLNVPMALGAVFTLIRKINPHLSIGKLSKSRRFSPAGGFHNHQFRSGAF